MNVETITLAEAEVMETCMKAEVDMDTIGVRPTRDIRHIQLQITLPKGINLMTITTHVPDTLVSTKLEMVVVVAATTSRRNLR